MIKLRPTRTYKATESLPSLPNTVSIIAGRPVSDRAKSTNKRLAAVSKLVWEVYFDSKQVLIRFNSEVIFDSDCNGHDKFFELTGLTSCKSILLDITQLPFDAWSLLLRYCLKVPLLLRVTYAEPMSYTRSVSDPYSYSLSDGLEPLVAAKGFVNLTVKSEANHALVVCMGFEPARLSQTLQIDELSSEQIYPILGMPGYHNMDPFISARMNFSHLIDASFRSNNILYIDSKCPFSLFHSLSELTHRNSIESIEISMIGTRPHALGSVLFSLVDRACQVELLYDYPIPSLKRTKGVSSLHVYYISEFLKLYSSNG